ncbi:hypothetical protein E2C01_074064 [Portunus trituberculatus]|uniref:Uncharacterized protein n=1 Tax=Portunus trituberculatus TaxID=210409 RepID=A0A5B7IFY0_PORTR|nr:hypothetical protein [Portunus trituberculatus]
MSLSQVRENSDHALRNCDLRLRLSRHTLVEVVVEVGEVVVEGVQSVSVDCGRLAEEQSCRLLSANDKLRPERLVLAPVWRGLGLWLVLDLCFTFSDGCRCQSMSLSVLVAPLRKRDLFLLVVSVLEYELLLSPSPFLPEDMAELQFWLQDFTSTKLRSVKQTDWRSGN